MSDAAVDNQLLRDCLAIGYTNDILYTGDERERGIKLLLSLNRNRALIKEQMSSPHFDLGILKLQPMVDKGQNPEFTALLTERDALSAKIRHLRISFSPQKHIPPELLARIFRHTIGDAVNFPIDVKQTCWVLLRVCSRWRYIALAEPSLWSSVSLKVTAVESLTNAISFLQSTLPASGQLYMKLESNNRSHVVDDRLNLIVVPYLSRLRKLHLRIREPEVDQLTRLPSQLLGLIEDLSLDVVRFGYTLQRFRPKLAQLEIFRHMKNMQMLALNDAAHIVLNPYIPLHQLLHLDLSVVRYWTFEELIQLLHPCTSLQHFSYPLNGPDDTVASTIAPEPILQKLESLIVSHLSLFSLTIPWSRITVLSLKIYVTIPEEQERVLSALAAAQQLMSLEVNLYQLYNYSGAQTILLPKLKSLSLRAPKLWFLSHLQTPELLDLCLGSVYEIHGEQLVDFITRSGCALQCLTYELNDFHKASTASLRILFNCTHTLRELHARLVGIDKSFLRSLADSAILPYLRFMEVTVEDIFDFVHMIERQVERRGELTSAYGHHSLRHLEAEERLLELNFLEGTDFRLVQDAD